MILKFVDRRKELDILERTVEDLRNESKNNIAIIGMRRIGKTELLLRFKEKNKANDVLYPYINLQRIGNLDSFRFLYVKELLYEAGVRKKKVQSKTELTKWEDLLILSAKLGVDNEVKKIYETKSIEILFESQEEILAKLDLFCIYLLDEFQYILNFKNFLNTMRAIVEKQKKISYIVTGSAISLMTNIFSQSDQPFFAQFRRITLGPLPKQDCKSLARFLLQKTIVSDSALNWVYKLTNGHPFHTISLCRRLREEFDEINIQTVKYAFLKEVLNENGDIYLLLDYIYNDSLSRAYKGMIHRQILLTLAQQDGLNLSEVSRRIGKPTGEMSNYLKFLLRTDLIIRQNNDYYFRDPLLRFWLAKTYLGIDLSELKQQGVVDDLINDLEEKFLKASSELGKAKEYEFKSKFEDEYGLKLSNYLSKDGQIELDLVGQKGQVTYIFEIKWRNKPSNYKDLKKFVEKVKNSKFKAKTRMFFAAQSFTDGARKYAKRSGIELIEEITAV